MGADRATTLARLHCRCGCSALLLRWRCAAAADVTLLLVAAEQMAALQPCCTAAKLVTCLPDAVMGQHDARCCIAAESCIVVAGRWGGGDAGAAQAGACLCV
jgi:hypothetical protein